MMLVLAVFTEFVDWRSSRQAEFPPRFSEAEGL